MHRNPAPSWFTHDVSSVQAKQAPFVGSAQNGRFRGETKQFPFAFRGQKIGVPLPQVF